jgi:hypothetical protein
LRFRTRQFDTCVQTPILSRFTIHFKLIEVSRRKRQAISTFAGCALHRPENICPNSWRRRLNRLVQVPKSHFLPATKLGSGVSTTK